MVWVDFCVHAHTHACMLCEHIIVVWRSCMHFHPSGDETLREFCFVGPYQDGNSSLKIYSASITAMNFGTQTIQNGMHIHAQFNCTISIC